MILVGVDKTTCSVIVYYAEEGINATDARLCAELSQKEAEELVEQLNLAITHLSFSTPRSL